MTGNGARADSGYQRALALFDSLPEPEPVERGGVEFARANRLLFKGAYLPADSAARRALRIYTRWNGPDNMLTAHSHVSLSVAAMGQNQLPRALAEIDSALRILQGKSVSVLEKTRIQIQQAMVLAGMGRMQEATNIAETVLAQRRAAIPDEPLMIGEATSLLGGYRVHDHRLAEAEKLYLESYASFDKAVGKTSPLTKTSAAALVFVYTAWGKPEQAAPYAAILPAGFVTSQEAAARKFARAGRP
jgi:hypothetical protein